LGKKRFAYPIQRETRGQYTTVVFLATGPVTAELERNLRINEEVLRFLTVCLGDDYSSAEHATQKENHRKAYEHEQVEMELRGPKDREEREERGGREDRGGRGGRGGRGDRDDRGGDRDDKKMMGKFGRKKDCRLSRHHFKGHDLDYKDIRLLQSYLTEHGQIVPRRVSSSTAISQRKLTRAIKRARAMALLDPATGRSAH